jgi:signal transduction histidine kinase
MLSSIIERKNGQPIPQDLKDMLSDASARLTDTINNVSEAVAAQTSENSDYKLVSINKTAKEALKTISAIISSANAQISLQIDDSLSVKGVQAYVDSIFLNLITNGIRYRSLDRPCEIKIKAQKVGRYVQMTFQDNGLGMDLKKYGHRLFGMYNTFHDHKDSNGIGLFITKNQIESMGGKIGVESEVGRGTTFNVELIAG